MSSDISGPAPGRWFRRLRRISAIMIVMVPFAAWLASITNRARVEERAAAGLARFRATATYRSAWLDEPVDPWIFERVAPAEIDEPRKPAWLERRLGRAFFDPIVAVRYGGGAIAASGTTARSADAAAIDPAFFTTIIPLGSLKRAWFDSVRIDRGALRELSAIAGIASLRFDSCRIDPEALALIERFPAMERLTLDAPRSFDAALVDWRKLARLKQFHLSGVMFAYDDSKSLAFLAMMPNLEGLGLSGCGLSSADFAPIAGLARLRSLNLAGVAPRADCLERMGAPGSLESLNLMTATSIPAASFARLGGLRKLRKLNVAATLFDDRALQAIRSLPQLDSLDISGTLVTPEGLAEFGLPKTLESFRFDKLRLMTRTISPQNEPLMNAIARLNRLAELSIDDQAVTDEGAAKLNGHSRLKALSLVRTEIRSLSGLMPESLPKLEFVDASWSRLDDSGLAALCRLPNLKRLIAERTRILSLAQVDFANAQHLEELSLAKTPIGDADLAHLAQARRLKILNLSQTAISDAGVAELKALPALEVLDLGSTSLSNESLRILQAMPTLRWLRIQTTEELTEPALLRFHEARPEVELEVIGTGQPPLRRSVPILDNGFKGKKGLQVACHTRRSQRETVGPRHHGERVERSSTGSFAGMASDRNAARGSIANERAAASISPSDCKSASVCPRPACPSAASAASDCAPWSSVAASATVVAASSCASDECMAPAPAAGFAPSARRAWSSRSDLIRLTSLARRSRSVFTVCEPRSVRSLRSSANSSLICRRPCASTWRSSRATLGSTLQRSLIRSSSAAALTDSFSSQPSLVLFRSNNSRLIRHFDNRSAISRSSLQSASLGFSAKMTASSSIRSSLKADSRSAEGRARSISN